MSDDHYVQPALSFFPRAGCTDFVCVSGTHLYHPGCLAVFLPFLDVVVKDKDGKGGPRAVAANPRGGAPFCCVRVLWEYLPRYPPTRGGSLFSGIVDTPLTH